MQRALQSQYLNAVAGAVSAQQGARAYTRFDPDWVAIKHPTLSGMQRRTTTAVNDMSTGTLLIELPAGHLTGAGRLIQSRTSDGTFDVWIDRKHGLVMHVQYGRHTIRASIPLRDALVSGVQRVGFAWDQTRNEAWFALWGAAHGACRVQRCELPAALPQSLMRASVLDQKVPGISAALAMRKMPLCALPGFGPTSVVDTVRGPMPMAELGVGDQLVLTDGEAARVVWAGEMVLPRTQSLRPVVLRAPYWGLAHDLTVAAGQELSLTGEDVEYLFSAPRVRVPIGSLGSRSYVRFIGKRPVETYAGVVLDRQGQMVVNGAAFDAPYVGAMLSSGGAGGTVLGDLPAPLRQNLSADRAPAAHLLGPLEVDSLLRFRSD